MTTRQTQWIIAGVIAGLLGLRLWLARDQVRLDAETCRSLHTDCAVGPEWGF